MGSVGFSGGLIKKLEINQVDWTVLLLNKNIEKIRFFLCEISMGFFNIVCYLGFLLRASGADGPRFGRLLLRRTGGLTNHPAQTLADPKMI